MATVESFSKWAATINISIAQPSSNRLVYKQQIKIVSPGEVILENSNLKILPLYQQRSYFL